MEALQSIHSSIVHCRFVAPYAWRLRSVEKDEEEWDRWLRETVEETTKTKGDGRRKQGSLSPCILISLLRHM